MRESGGRWPGVGGRWKVSGNGTGFLWYTRVRWYFQMRYPFFELGRAAGAVPRFRGFVTHFDETPWEFAQIVEMAYFVWIAESDQGNLKHL